MSAARVPTFYCNQSDDPWPYMEGLFRRMFDQIERSLLRMRAGLAKLPTAVSRAVGRNLPSPFHRENGPV